jgi:hypothetical protein
MGADSMAAAVASLDRTMAAARESGTVGLLGYRQALHGLRVKPHIKVWRGCDPQMWECSVDAARGAIASTPKAAYGLFKSRFA